MYARVSTIMGAPAQAEAGIKGYRDKTLPAMKKMPGYKGAYLLVDRKSGKFLSITLWSSMADLQASASAADKLREQGATDSAASRPPSYEVFEVAVNP